MCHDHVPMCLRVQVHAGTVGGGRGSASADACCAPAYCEGRRPLCLLCLRQEEAAGGAGGPAEVRRSPHKICKLLRAKAFPRERRSPTWIVNASTFQSAKSWHTDQQCTIQHHSVRLPPNLEPSLPCMAANLWFPCMAWSNLACTCVARYSVLIMLGPGQSTILLV